MFDKFNFYDFLGYLIPGATVVLTINLVAKWAFDLTLLDLHTDLGSSFLFLGISYVAGHLVQEAGSRYEYWLNNRCGGFRLSERLLMPTDSDRLKDIERFSPELKARVFTAAKIVFNSAEDPGEVFEKCYALLVQQNLGQQTEVFLALNGLARGMVVASGVGVLVGCLVIAKQFVLLDLAALGFKTSDMGTWTFSWSQVLFATAVIAISILAGYSFRREFERFRVYFAKSVYYNFLAWFGARQSSK